MLRLSCCLCGSMFLVKKLPEGRPLCYQCRTVAAAVHKHTHARRKACPPPHDPKAGAVDSKK